MWSQETLRINKKSRTLFDVSEELFLIVLPVYPQCEYYSWDMYEKLYKLSEKRRKIVALDLLNDDREKMEKAEDKYLVLVIPLCSVW